jgi:hypothetical protein
MKALTLVSALLATAFAEEAALPGSSRDTQVIPLDNPLSRSTVQGEKVIPRMSQSTPKDGATRKTMKYGSWSVTSTKMMSTFKLVQGPCSGNCYVTAMEATIRYPSGEEANVDTGAWLHHIALFGSGAGQGSLWAAGNERPTLRLNVGDKYGLDFPSAFMMMIDLMTEDTKPKNLTLEITYETVPKTGGYKGANMYWLTIGEPRAKQGQYKFSTLPSSSSVSGSLLYAIGHMHDGGTDMKLFVNSKLVCKSVMHYNARPGYVPGGGMKVKRQHGHGGGGAMHISDPGACTSFGTVNKGDVLTAEAWYDAAKYGLMTHNGKMENLMGNMRVYVGPK